MPKTLPVKAAHLPAAKLVKTRFEPLLCAAIVVLCLAPFVAKPFHIDDPLFLWAAKHIQSHPFDFYGFTVNWYGFDMPMADVTKNPPLACYYIAAIASIFGFSELALHIAFLIPAAAAALGTYYLARHFTSRPLEAALAALLTPCFIVSATSLMCDVMMLAFWVWAVYFWMEGTKSSRPSLLLVSAVLTSLCALTKYYGITLLVLLPVYSIIHNRRLSAHLLVLLIPLAVLAGYQWATYLLYGKGLLRDAAAYASAQNLKRNARIPAACVTALAFTGGCVISALFYSPLLWSRLPIIAMAVIAVVLPVAVAPSVLLQSGLWHAQLILMVIGGVGVLLLAITDFFRERTAQSVLLALWVIGTFIFTAFINWSINARSILPMVPAVGILIMRRIERMPRRLGDGGSFWKTAWPLVPAAIVALAVCHADYALAASARKAASTICDSYHDQLSNVRFQGHWGFQYYMQQAGVKPFDLKSKEILTGSLVVCPLGNTNIVIFPREMAEPSSALKFETVPWLAVMNAKLGAGFYGISIPMPFVFEKPAPQEYTLYRMK